MSLAAWYREDRDNVSTAFSDEFRGITALQVVSTAALGVAIFLNAYLNVWVYYDGFGPLGMPFIAAAAAVAIALGIIWTLLVRISGYLLAAVPSVAFALLALAEAAKGHFGVYLGVTLLPGVIGAYGIWRRAFLPLYIGFIALVASIFVYSNPIDTPIAPVFGFAATALLYLEAGHIAITFTRVKARVLENQKLSAVFVNLYRRVILRYGISASTALLLTVALTYVLVDMNSLFAYVGSGLVVHSFEMTSFTGVVISATIGLLVISLVRSAMPR
ncbi:MAG: hypothetical protein L0Z54_05820 [Thermoplasmata archaeon]|nr:hypothetical protein [Thermoplasmata archaeon]